MLFRSTKDATPSPPLIELCHIDRSQPPDPISASCNCTAPSWQSDDMHIQNVVPHAKCVFLNVDPPCTTASASRRTDDSPQSICRRQCVRYSIFAPTKSPRSEGTSRASPAPLGASLKPYPSLSCTSRSPPNSITTSSSQQQQLSTLCSLSTVLSFSRRLTRCPDRPWDPPTSARPPSPAH